MPNVLLPWVKLAQRTAIHGDLQTSPAELTFGTHPVLPADLLGDPAPPNTQEEVESLLKHLRFREAQHGIHMTLHSTQEPYVPDLSEITHVHLKKGKPLPFGKQYNGPFEIVVCLGNACVRIRVGQTRQERENPSLR